MCSMHNASTSWNVPERGTRSSIHSCRNDMRFDLLTLRFCRDIDELRWRWIPRRRALNFVSVLAYWITSEYTHTVLSLHEGNCFSWRSGHSLLQLFEIKVDCFLNSVTFLPDPTYEHFYVTSKPWKHYKHFVIHVAATCASIFPLHKVVWCYRQL